MSSALSLPEDLKLENLVLYLQNQETMNSRCDIHFQGPHGRNTYKDISEIETYHISGENDKQHIRYEINTSRKGLYDSLPECLFHDINRFTDIHKSDWEKSLPEQCRELQTEETNARNFFYPTDIALFLLKLKTAEYVQELSSSNSVLQNIIGDAVSEEDKSNRFIRKAFPFLPYCKTIRGNRTLISLMLRKIFSDEQIAIESHNESITGKDTLPRYQTEIGDSLDSVFLGTERSDIIHNHHISLWIEEECSERFPDFIDEIERFRLFIQDFFISIEETLIFDIIKNEPTVLNDDRKHQYLNYNTDIE